MRNEKWKNDFSPIDANSTLFADRDYSKAYLRHLYTAGEMLGAMIGSLHNLHFFMDLVTQARQHLLAGDFSSWKDSVLHRIARRI
jgi:queuine tRNA-ribosyltransferase